MMMTSKKQWSEKQIRIRRDWLAFLGKGPATKCPLYLERIDREILATCIRDTVRYQVHEGCWVEAYLIKPKKVHGKMPGIVSFHQTIDCTIDEAGGISGCPDLHLGLRLAEEGYITINPRCFLWDYHREQRPESVARFLEDYPRWKGMGKMLWDGIRAVDVLAGLPEVDPGRIAAIGHSLGGKEAFYLAAFDRRIKAAVVSEPGIGLDMSNWDANHYLGPEIHNPDFTLNHLQILELIAPKPFLLIAGDNCDDNRSEKFLRTVQPVYDLYGKPESICFLNHHQGHTFPKPAWEKTCSFLNHNLQGSKEKRRRKPACTP